jgi:hypothetical protein
LSKRASPPLIFTNEEGKLWLSGQELFLVLDQVLLVILNVGNHLLDLYIQMENFFLCQFNLEVAIQKLASYWSCPWRESCAVISGSQNIKISKESIVNHFSP